MQKTEHQEESDTAHRTHVNRNSVTDWESQNITTMTVIRRLYAYIVEAYDVQIKAALTEQSLAVKEHVSIVAARQLAYKESFFGIRCRQADDDKLNLNK